MKSSKARGFVAGGAAVALVALGVVLHPWSTGATESTSSRGGGAASASTHTIHGTFDVDGGGWTPGGSCGGTGGFSDLVAGAPVTIADSSGTTLATTYVQGATATGTDTCRLSFTLTDVPTSRAYRISIGHRDGLPGISYEQLQGDGWNAHLRF